MFKWFDGLALGKPIHYLREMTLTQKAFFPDWLLFSLPDGLWVFSYVSLILWLWDNKLNGINSVWIFLIPFVAIASEFGQLIGIVPGTFDITDLIFYILGTTLPIIIYTKQISINKIAAK